MQQRPVQEKSDARPRVVDVIAEGLSLIVTRPWLMLVPILLDVVIWLGVKIEPSALINELIDLVEDSTIADTEDVISTGSPAAGAAPSSAGAPTGAGAQATR